MKPTARQKLLFAALLFGALAALAPRAFAQGGVPLWTNRHDGLGLGSHSIAITVDSSDNVLVTGYSYYLSGQREFITVKYSGAGVPLWTNRFRSQEFSEDEAHALAIDRNGNVFVSGSLYSTNYLTSYAIVAYSDLGLPLWTNIYGSPGKSWDDGGPIASDNDGHVFVTGTSDGTNGSPDYATVAYSTAGLSLWTNRYDGPGHRDDVAVGMAMDAYGNMFVTGWSMNTNVPPYNYDYATVAYSAGGVPLWTNRYSGQPDSDDFAWTVEVDRNNDVVVTGFSVGESNDYDYATIKYSGIGMPLWTNRYNGSDNASDVVSAMAIDNGGNVFVTGTSELDYPFSTIKYSHSGTPLWTNRFGGQGGSNGAKALAVDDCGNVFVAGYSSESVFQIVAYSSLGVPLWTNANDNADATAMAIDSTGNVIVTGNATGTNGYPVFITIKYSSSIPPVHLDFQLLNNELVLSWTNSGFSLQTAPASTGTFTNLPGATSPYTNPITAAQQFFRLRKN